MGILVRLNIIFQRCNLNRLFIRNHIFSHHIRQPFVFSIAPLLETEREKREALGGEIKCGALPSFLEIIVKNQNLSQLLRVLAVVDPLCAVLHFAVRSTTLSTSISPWPVSVTCKCFFHLHLHNSMISLTISYREAALRRKNNIPPIKVLLPLIYAPVLPLSQSLLSFSPSFNLFIFVWVFPFFFYFFSWYSAAAEWYVVLIVWIKKFGLFHPFGTLSRVWIRISNFSELLTSWHIYLFHLHSLYWLAWFRISFPSLPNIFVCICTKIYVVGCFFLLE